MSPARLTSFNIVMPRDPEWALFGTADQAIDDLLRCLDDGNVSERGALCSSALRTRRAPRELVLRDSANWACVVHQVRAGEHLTDAGDHYFARWSRR